MPSHRQRASAASAETRGLFPKVANHVRNDPAKAAVFWPYTTPAAPPAEKYMHRLRSAVSDGDPFDIAVDWQNYSFRQYGSPGSSSGESTHSHHRSHGHRSGWAEDRAPDVYMVPFRTKEDHTDRVLVLNTASEKRPGGDWEGGVLGAEESLARRSNLVDNLPPHAYPLPQTGGIYSPNVVVIRDGHERDYNLWPESEWTVVSVVSVAAIARPKVDETGTKYSFTEERELQKEKMKTVLRLAVRYGHVNLVLGGFGSCGPGTGDGHGGSSGHNAVGHAGSSYKNPIKDVCKIWQELLMHDPEFRGRFKNVVFAVGGGEGGGAREFRRYFG